jgi:glycosyltransferase involved in cell wall biosynthesis
MTTAAVDAPLVSVITPCYRQGHLLAQAIDSVLAQAYPNTELIVVNDGSDDDTDDVARRYGSRIVYVPKTNGGLPSARNAGLAVARGQYALFLDADDLLAPDAIAALVAALNGRRDALAVGGWQHFQTSPSVDATAPMYPVVSGSALETVMSRNIAPVHAFLAPVAMVRDAGGFGETLKACEDWDCWTRLIVGGAEVVTVSDVVAFYRNTPASMSKNFDRMLLTRVDVLLRLHHLLAGAPALLQSHGTSLAASMPRTPGTSCVRRSASCTREDSASRRQPSVASRAAFSGPTPKI